MSTYQRENRRRGEHIIHRGATKAAPSQNSSNALIDNTRVHAHTRMRRWQYLLLEVGFRAADTHMRRAWWARGVAAGQAAFASACSLARSRQPRSLTHRLRCNSSGAHIHRITRPPKRIALLRLRRCGVREGGRFATLSMLNGKETKAKTETVTSARSSFHPFPFSFPLLVPVFFFPLPFAPQLLAMLRFAQTSVRSLPARVGLRMFSSSSSPAFKHLTVEQKGATLHITYDETNENGSPR